MATLFLSLSREREREREAFQTTSCSSTIEFLSPDIGRQARLDNFFNART